MPGTNEGLYVCEFLSLFSHSQFLGLTDVVRELYSNSGLSV